MIAKSSETAQGDRVVRPGGLSPMRMKRMGDVMRRQIESGRLPGLVTLVCRGGEAHVDAMGTLSFGDDAPMGRDTIFRLASTTKPITAVATMILVEECKLRLDDAVDEWLPELKDRKVLRTTDSTLDDTVSARRPITVRDLLTFRAGYGEVIFLGGFSPMQRALMEARLPLSDWPFDGSPDEFMKRLGALPLVHQPGERWLYHMAAEILGVLIARVSGKSLGTFLSERIFEPLGMKDTGFGVADAKMGRVAACYYTDPSSGHVAVLEEAGDVLFSRLRVFESGAGGLVSTADDLLAFGRMMLNKGSYGRERILSRPTVELMTTDQLTAEQKAGSPFFPNFWDGCGWGLGLGIITERRHVGRSAGSFGWDGAFGTSFWIDPKENMIGILMTQRRPDVLALPTVVLDFWSAAYQAIDD